MWPTHCENLKAPSPLVVHLVDKVGTKDPPSPFPPPPLVAHMVDKVGTKDPPPPPTECT